MDTHTVNDGTNTLFANDNVDATVLKELLQYINDESIWKDDLNQDIAIPKGDEVVYLTAENFSNANDNARIVVKLFDTTNLEQDDYSIVIVSQMYKCTLHLTHQWEQAR